MTWTTVGIREPKARPSHYLLRVKAGATVVITLHPRGASCPTPTTPAS